MFNSMKKFFDKCKEKTKTDSKTTKTDKTKKEDTDASRKFAKDRLHVLLFQDRASVSADFIDMMKEEVLEVISKYVVLDKEALDLEIVSKNSEKDGKTKTEMNIKIPVLNIRNEMKSHIVKTEDDMKSKIIEVKKNEVLYREDDNELLYTEELVTEKDKADDKLVDKKDLKEESENKDKVKKEETKTETKKDDKQENKNLDKQEKAEKKEKAAKSEKKEKTKIVVYTEESTTKKPTDDKKGKNNIGFGKSIINKLEKNEDNSIIKIGGKDTDLKKVKKKIVSDKKYKRNIKNK